MTIVTYNYLYFFLILTLITSNYKIVKALIVGSTSSVSSQGTITFPSVDTNNLIQGFTFFERGFTLQDKLTTCTFNGYYPVTSSLTLNAGALYLQQDLVLSNTSAFAATGGRIYGNNYAVIFPHQQALYEVPAPLNNINFQLNFIDSEAMFAPVRSVDWSGDSSYLAACSDVSAANNELKLYYFDGNIITTTQSIEINRATFSVSWNKKHPYIALAVTTNPQSQMRVFRVNFSNGTSILTDVREFGRKACYAVEWHPTGTYLMAGKQGGSNAELESYSLDTVTGLLTNISIGDLSPNRDVGFNAISFSPTGNYSIVGTAANASAGGYEAMVRGFTSASNDLPTLAFADPSITVQAVSWHPTSQTYFAIGYLNAGTNRIRLYQFNKTAGTMTEILSTPVVENNNVTCMHWHPSGNFLAVGIDNGVNSRVDAYYFNSTALTLTKVQSIASPAAITTIAWSPNGSYLAWGDSANNVRIYGIDMTSLLFDNCTIVLNSPTLITGKIFLNNRCSIQGNGNQLSFGQDGALLVRKNSSLELDNVILSGVQDNKIICLDDSGALTYESSELRLTGQYTYSRGSLLFSGINTIKGEQSFIFSSRGTMSIDTQSTLCLLSGARFEYSPVTAKRTLIYFPDRSAQLYLDQASLQATSTGLLLRSGTLLLDNNVTFSSQGQSSAEGIILDNSLAIELLGNAELSLHGFIVTT